MWARAARGKDASPLPRSLSLSPQKTGSSSVAVAVSFGRGTSHGHAPPRFHVELIARETSCACRRELKRCRLQDMNALDQLSAADPVLARFIEGETQKQRFQVDTQDPWSFFITCLATEIVQCLNNHSWVVLEVCIYGIWAEKQHGSTSYHLEGKENKVRYIKKKKNVITNMHCRRNRNKCRKQIVMIDDLLSNYDIGHISRKQHVKNSSMWSVIRKNNADKFNAWAVT